MERLPEHVLLFAQGALLTGCSAVLTDEVYRPALTSDLAQKNTSTGTMFEMQQLCMDIKGIPHTLSSTSFIPGASRAPSSARETGDQARHDQAVELHVDIEPKVDGLLFNPYRLSLELETGDTIYPSEVRFHGYDPFQSYADKRQLAFSVVFNRPSVTDIPKRIHFEGLYLHGHTVVMPSIHLTRERMRAVRMPDAGMVEAGPDDLSIGVCEAIKQVRN